MVKTTNTAKNPKEQQNTAKIKKKAKKLFFQIQLKIFLSQ
jgi:hypothetical protein